MSIVCQLLRDQGRNASLTKNILIARQNSSEAINQRVSSGWLGMVRNLLLNAMASPDKKIVKWMHCFTCSFRMTSFGRYQRISNITSSPSASMPWPILGGKWFLYYAVFSFFVWWITVALYLRRRINGIFHPFNRYWPLYDNILHIVRCECTMHIVGEWITVWSGFYDLNLDWNRNGQTRIKS